ncbi:MAG TPA: OmpA family protein [Stellaceae bacterium]|nr:OmpA family protein [Stellaceae bacterium]
MIARAARFPLLGLGLALAFALTPLTARADWRWHGGPRFGVFVGGWPGYYPYYAPYYAYYPPPYYYPPYAPAYYRPPPPPAPAYGPTPAVAPAPLASQGRSFRVFFEFDKASLTAEGERVVRQAAETYRRTGVARVEVTGYTDLAGTPRYDLDLSKRRAATVRAALIAQGIPGNSITERWRGKDDPLVRTADGVREPQNRRVDIVLP